jgi:hypothetical protein
MLKLKDKLGGNGCLENLEERNLKDRKYKVVSRVSCTRRSYRLTTNFGAARDTRRNELQPPPLQDQKKHHIQNAIRVDDKLQAATHQSLRHTCRSGIIRVPPCTLISKHPIHNVSVK